MPVPPFPRIAAADGPVDPLAGRFRCLLHCGIIEKVGKIFARGAGNRNGVSDASDRHPEATSPDLELELAIFPFAEPFETSTGWPDDLRRLVVLGACVVSEE